MEILINNFPVLAILLNLFKMLISYSIFILKITVSHFEKNKMVACSCFPNLNLKVKLFRSWFFTKSRKTFWPKCVKIALKELINLKHWI